MNLSPLTRNLGRLGGPESTDMREMLNAIFYVLRSRCQAPAAEGLSASEDPGDFRSCSGAESSSHFRADPAAPQFRARASSRRGPRLAVYPPSSGCCNAAHFETAVLTVRKAGSEKPVEYVTIKMQEVLITSVSIGGCDGDDRFDGEHRLELC